MNDDSFLPIVAGITLSSIGSAIFSLVPGVGEKYGLTSERAFFACFAVAGFLMVVNVLVSCLSLRDKQASGTKVIPNEIPVPERAEGGEEKKVDETPSPSADEKTSEPETPVDTVVFFGTTTGTAKELAKRLSESLAESGVKAEVKNLAECDVDSLSNIKRCFFCTLHTIRRNSTIILS